MIIGVDMGHTLSGAGTGAVGYESESAKNRLVGKRLMEMLQEKGHKVVNCTVDYSNNDLRDRANKANAQHLDVFISLHLNAFKMTTSPMGVEVYTYSGGSSAVGKAKAVLSEVVAATGWKNRGHKTAGYYVLRHTKAPAMLLEMGFCDSKADMDLWNTEKIAAAIFKGLTGVAYSPNFNKPTNDSSKSNTYFRVCVGSYKDKRNAEEQQAKLKKAGFDSFLVAFNK